MTKGCHSVVAALALASRQRPLEEPNLAKVQLAFDKCAAPDDKDLNAEADELSTGPNDPEAVRAHSRNDGTSDAPAAKSRAGVSQLTAEAAKKGAGQNADPRTASKATRRMTAIGQAHAQGLPITAAMQKADDLRMGEEWNQKLQTPANRNNAELCERFWADMKVRIIRHFGTINRAFEKVDTSGDGSIGFLEFVSMLQVINLPLEMRVARAMFEKASCGDRELSLVELKTLLMEKTIQKLQSTMRGFNKKQERVRRHVHRFVKFLCQASEPTLERAVDRLQRKLTTTFCREFWTMLKVHLAKVHSDGDLERAEFLKVVRSAIGTHFMAYEIIFLQRIFDRIDKHKRGCIHLRDLMTTLVLLSEESDKMEKLHFLFEVFDTDCDGCLLYDQILAMMRCICEHRPIVEENTTSVQAARHESGLTFQEELTSQDGLRLYECLFWYLQRTVKLDSDIVTWNELCHAFEHLPAVANAALPGLFRIQWVLEPSAMEEVEQEEAPAAPDASTPDYSSVPGPPRSRAQTAPAPLCRSQTGLLLHEDRDERHHPANPDQMDHHPTRSQSRGNTTGPAPVQRTASHEHHGDADSMPVSTRDLIQATMLGKRVKSDSRQQQAHVPAWEPRETTTIFKRNVTNKFISSLRSFGDVRYGQMLDGFNGIEEVTPKEEFEADDAARPVSRGGTELVRPGSSQAGQKPPTAAGSDRKGLKRVNSAPSGHKKRGNQPGARPGSCPTDGLGQRPSSQSGSVRKSSSAAELPLLEVQKWGMEAAERFKLFSTVKSGKNNQRHLQGACGGGDGLGYKCQLCRGPHTMLTNF